MFVDYQNIAKKEVFGTFRKYTYFCNNFPNYVYCHSERDFLKLIAYWNTKGGKTYNYTFKNLEGEEIQLKDIPADNKFKIKMYLTCPYNGVSYIS